MLFGAWDSGCSIAATNEKSRSRIAHNERLVAVRPGRQVGSLKTDCERHRNGALRSEPAVGLQGGPLVQTEYRAGILGWQRLVLRIRPACHPSPMRTRMKHST